MKAFEVAFGNTKLWGAGTHCEVSLTILAEDLTDALMKAADGVESVKDGLKKAGVLRDVDTIRVMKVEERDPVLNPKGDLDPGSVLEIVAAMKDDLITE